MVKSFLLSGFLPSLALLVLLLENARLQHWHPAFPWLHWLAVTLAALGFAGKVADLFL